MNDNSISERLTITKNFGPDKGRMTIFVTMDPAMLSSIDQMVERGCCASRSDFINQAVQDAMRRLEA